MKPPVPTERQVQRSILSMMARCFPRVFVHHSPNGGHLAGSERQRYMQVGALKGDGMKTGFPDLLCIWNHGIALMEVKRPKYTPSQVSAEQRYVHGVLAEMGYEVRIVTSPDEAYLFLRERGAPCAGELAIAA